jgi:hypothetical protein
MDETYITSSTFKPLDLDWCKWTETSTATQSFVLKNKPIKVHHLSLVHSCNVSSLAAAASSSSSSGSLAHKCVSPSYLLVINSRTCWLQIAWILLWRSGSDCCRSEKQIPKNSVSVWIFCGIFLEAGFLELERRVLFCFCSCCCFWELPALLRGEGGVLWANVKEEVWRQRQRRRLWLKGYVQQALWERRSHRRRHRRRRLGVVRMFSGELSSTVRDSQRPLSPPGLHRILTAKSAEQLIGFSSSWAQPSCRSESLVKSC